MNPIQERIHIRLNTLGEECTPLAEAARSYLRFCSAIDVDDTVLIAHMPWDAPLAYAFRLWPAAKSSWFGKYEKIRGIHIPRLLRPLFCSVNGCLAFGFSLYGMAPSMLTVPPKLDRSSAQCHDLSLANGNHGWKFSYKGAEDGFHFGSRHYNSTENAGYFLFGTRIVSLLKDGSIVGEWTDLGNFLRDEITAAESLVLTKTPQDWWH